MLLEKHLISAFKKALELALPLLLSYCLVSAAFSNPICPNWQGLLNNSEVKLHFQSQQDKRVLGGSMEEEPFHFFREILAFTIDDKELMLPPRFVKIFGEELSFDATITKS
ncbi:hypothetical protein AB3S75_043312 [Citrus x aurantiifolia]